MSKKQGRVGRPGIFEISPQIGTIKPAPAETKMSLTTILKPTGAPLTVGSAVNEFDVFAIQIGRKLKPWNLKENVNKLVYCGA